MLSQNLRQLAVNRRPSASGGDCSITSTSEASVGRGVVVAFIGAAAEHRFLTQRGAAVDVAPSREARAPRLCLAVQGSVAYGHVTYNQSFERTKFQGRTALLVAAQLQR